MTKPNTKPDFDKVDLTLPLGAFSSFDMVCIYPALKRSKQDDVYLEIGVDKGKSLAFARKYFKGDVFGIDIVDNSLMHVEGANFILSDSNDVSWTLPIKVLFIDGDHSYEQVKNDYEKYSPFVVKDGWIFFHDADSGGVLTFLEELGGAKWYKKPGLNTGMASIRK